MAAGLAEHDPNLLLAGLTVLQGGERAERRIARTRAEGSKLVQHFAPSIATGISMHASAELLTLNYTAPVLSGALAKHAKNGCARTGD